MRKARLITGLLVNGSIIIAIWAALVFGAMNVWARQACLEYKFARAVITPKYGTVCVTITPNGEAAVLLSRIREIEALNSE